MELRWSIAKYFARLLINYSRPKLQVSSIHEKNPKWNSICSTVASLNRMAGYTVTTSSKAAAASAAAAAVILTFPLPHPCEENRLYNLCVCLEDKEVLLTNVPWNWQIITAGTCSVFPKLWKAVSFRVPKKSVTSALKEDLIP